MELKMAVNRQTWNDFLTPQAHAEFLQSWEWGEFQKSFGRRVWRVGFFKGSAQVGAAQILEHYLGLGMGYLYCPRGPAGRFSLNDWLYFLRAEISNYGEIFLRFEPASEDFLKEAAGSVSVRRAASVQPARELIINLEKEEDELLKEMCQKTRYNIRLAMKKGLKFQAAKTSEDKQKIFATFWQMMKKTARRDKIKLHPRKYYELMLGNLPQSGLFIVWLGDKILTGGIFLGFGDTFNYLHGAFDAKHRETMAPYLLHWSAMRLAKEQGFKYYNFGGVNPENEADFNYRQSWEGITRFKKGFGGFIFSRPGTFEIPLNGRGYRIYQFLKKARRCL
ncbi:MAG: peptidoglycan bridge formation glycyltransferase FemA/FemB family protein [Candidatus Magasanikbacteria bacterium]|nr:peptidoglycan bridge formation glycyltransferase FemA/FemB family protein [Candidatus Magasanikbacteria bacterium]